MATSSPPEIWAFCAECERWFYCERWFDHNAGRPSCPVCTAEPAEVKDRANGPAEVGEFANAGSR
jgi:hypothetical protein